MSQTPRPRDSATIHVTDRSILGARTSELLRRMQAGVGRPDPDDPAVSLSVEHRLSLESGGAAVGGLRSYLSARAGQGYWDFIEVGPGFFTSRDRRRPTSAGTPCASPQNVS